MENNEIIELCQQIYAEHKEALDLIFENRPDRLQNVSEFFKEWCKKQHKSNRIILDEEKCSKSYVRFRTPFMENFIMQSNGISGWNTKNHYFYEIRNNEGTGFLMSLTLSSRNLTDEQRDICNKINEHFPSRQQKANWQWRTPFATKQVKIDEELSEEKIFEQLDKKLLELKAFEEKLYNAMFQD